MISMKINNLKNIALGLLLAPLAFVGCVEEQTDPAATAVATSEPEVTFAAKEAPEQVIQVYADGEWAADYEAEWVSISPISGNGLTDVTIIVDDNLASDGTVAAPREAKVIFRGKYTERQAELTIYQKGDNFRDAKELSIAEASKLEDKKTTKLPDVQIVATSADGVLVKDATGHMYVAYKGDCKIGDKVYVAGEKTTVNGLPAIKDAEVTVNSNAEFTYPTAANLLENLDPSKANDYLYVTVEAGLLGSVLQFETSLPVSVNLLSPKAENGIDLEAVNMHNVKVDGYFVGLNGTTVNLIVTKIEDKGMNDDLRAYFYDDFSWMKPFLDEYNKNATPVGDAVGTDNPSAEAPNLRTAGGLAGLLDEFLARGYEDLNKEAKVIYPQSYYWKFGKTSNHGGLMLPKMELEGSTLINAVLSFSWSPHMTGSGNIDKVSVVAELEGAGFFDNGTNVSDPFVHELQKGDLNWHNVSILLKGVNNSTRIKIRPLNFTAADPDQQRWHLDNVKVAPSDIPYKDPVYADVTLSDDIVTFEGTPSGAVELKIKSNKDWTLTKGLDSDWFDIDVTSGLADEETVVKVTAQPSTSITMRKSTITLASADTRKTIHVVQSAAGGELEPLISVIGGNNLKLDGLKGEFTLEVQSNVDYEIVTDVDWLNEVVQPATKAIVETRTHVFAKTDNLTGAVRTGTIKFVSESAKHTMIVLVSQDIFEPYVNAAPVYKTAFLSGYAGSLNFSIKANVPYTVSTDANWIKLPATEGPAQDIEIPISFDANPSDAVRTATITFKNEQYNYSASYQINQYQAGYVFIEDFSWMKPMIEAYNKAASKPIGDTVGSNGKNAEAPNAYTAAAWLATDFWKVFESMGYENTNPDLKVLYPQDAYLKFGKTGAHSGLYLPSIEPNGDDVTLTFNWCAQVQGSGVIDPTKILVELEGEGVCGDTNAKISTPTGSTQESGTYAWQTYTVKLKDINAGTRILIRHNDMTSGKAIRFHLDNIKITK